MSKAYNVAVIGGGVLGCAIARALVLKNIEDIVLLEKEDNLALHTSGRNSGVVHSGFHLKPGSLKAQLCVEGSQRIARYCSKREIAYRQVGKLVVASSEAECERLPELEHRAEANGIQGARIVDEAELREIEPHAHGIVGFHSPVDGIIDARQFVLSLAEDARNAGVEIKCGHRLIDASEEQGQVRLKTSRGQLSAKFVINCAGLYADYVARLFGIGREYTIVPFRGEYYQLVPEKRDLVHGLIYPLSDPKFPFLGVHFTKTIDGDVLIGPNAVLAFGRESYQLSEIRWRETLATLASRNFLGLISNSEFMRLALKELRTSFSKKAFVREAQRLIPDVQLGDFTKGRAGNRAQLVDHHGHLVEDFVIEHTDRSAHILNAVSPGFTCSLAFADYVLEQLARQGFMGYQSKPAPHRVQK